MTLQTINIGTNPNDGTGDSLRAAMQKINSNFSGLTGTLGAGFSTTTGVIGDIVVPYNCTVNSVSLLVDQAGSAVVDIWKNTYANFPPSSSNSICASALPTVSNAVKYQDSSLTGWTKSFSAGDVLRFNLTSASGITRGIVQLNVTRV